VWLGDEGNVAFKCHAGCKFEDIVKALGMKPGDMFADNGKSNGNGSGNDHAHEERASLTLAEFATHKSLPVEALVFYGLRDAMRYGRPCVEFEYRRRDGTFGRTRERVKLPKPGQFWWKDEGKPEPEMIAYEPDLGRLAQAQHYTVIVEGESDVLTLLHAGIPALGIPGANNTKVLRAEHVAGLNHVFCLNEKDDSGAIFAKEVPRLLLELGFKGEVHELKMPGSAKDPSALYQRDPAAFPAVFRKLLDETLRPPHRFDPLWLTVGKRGSLNTKPPPRQWLLQRPDEETNQAGNPIGVLPLGKTGLLIAQGGSGKTIALVQLAISVATGRRWLDHYFTPRPGRVLLALAEEDGEEVDRRIYDIAEAMRLTDAQREQVAQNVVALGLAGQVSALVAQNGHETVETDVLLYFRRRLNEGAWALVVLDTLSRFAGGDTEKDSGAATRFMEAAESLSLTPGRPTVLIAHHTNKISRVEGATTSASNARGSSALTDSARWVANLDSAGEGTVKFTITKSNYAPESPPVTLQRSQEHGGCLSALSRDAVVQQADKQLERVEKLIPDVLDLLTKRPGLSKGEIRDRLLTKRSDAYAVVDHMKRSGLLIEKPKNSYSIAPSAGGTS
jgi:hypothetical protein